MGHPAGRPLGLLVFFNLFEAAEREGNVFDHTLHQADDRIGKGARLGEKEQKYADAASIFQNWNRRGGADPFASVLFAPGPESLVILKVIGYAGASRPKGRTGDPAPVLGIRVDGDSDISER
ncbi:MAG TPA: hypothetical protein VNZ53_56350, partial [Steroidobacteraceae bacterium]|nr:hypothetical protein [Steroidobacteraceae bacterium]